MQGPMSRPSPAIDRYRPRLLPLDLLGSDLLRSWPVPLHGFSRRCLLTSSSTSMPADSPYPGSCGNAPVQDLQGPCRAGTTPRPTSTHALRRPVPHWLASLLARWKLRRCVKLRGESHHTSTPAFRRSTSQPEVYLQSTIVSISLKKVSESCYPRRASGYVAPVRHLASFCIAETSNSVDFAPRVGAKKNGSELARPVSGLLRAPGWPTEVSCYAC